MPPSDGGAVGTLGPADFSTFVVSMASNAMLHLGVPVEGQPAVEIDLVMAKHTIELLAMLEGKTQGNLAPEEHKLLSGLLYQLRIAYVDAKKRA